MQVLNRCLAPRLPSLVQVSVSSTNFSKTLNPLQWNDPLRLAFLLVRTGGRGFFAISTSPDRWTNLAFRRALRFTFDRVDVLGSRNRLN
jgi:hypothetical protein